MNHRRLEYKRKEKKKEKNPSKKPNKYIKKAHKQIRHIEIIKKHRHIHTYIHTKKGEGRDRK